MKYSTLTVGNSLQELQKKLSVHVEHVETLIKEAEGASESVSCMFRLYIPTLINCHANAKGTYLFNDILPWKISVFLREYCTDVRRDIKAIGRDFEELNDDNAGTIATKWYALTGAPDPLFSDSAV